MLICALYPQHDYAAHPINPRGGEIEGVTALEDVRSLPKGVACLSVITPPKFADAVVEAAQAVGVQHVWFQPGASSESAVKAAAELGMSVIADGTCALVELGEAPHHK